MISSQGMDAANPLRPVDWRARVARRLAGTRRRPSPRHHDQVTVQLTRFYRRRDASSHQSAAVGPFDRDLVAAVGIDEDPTGLNPALLQAQLLGAQPLTDIAATLGITDRVVAWYAAAFFDVLDRLGNTVFIQTNVIGAVPPRNEKNGIIAWCWRQAAYFGGIGELETILAIDQQTADGTQVP